MATCAGIAPDFPRATGNELQFSHPERNMQRALLWKLSTVLALCLLALIPLAMVRGIIAERQSLRDGVIRSFETETVGPQILKGPVLVIPYRKTVTETSEERGSSQGAPVEIKRKRTVDGRLFFLPETLEIDGNAGVQERRRAIYKAQAYSANWKVAGRFDLPAHLAVGPDHAQYTWGTPELGFGIGDPRGLEPGVSLTLNGKHAALEAGTSVPGLGRGVHAPVDTARAQSGVAQSVEFELDMSLTGLNRVQFLPTGRTSTVKFASAWPHPSFFGPLLAQHQIDANGFRAVWKTSFLASDLPNEYAECFEGKNCDAFNGAAFGVSLVEPADLYQQLERSVKYGLLFVGLTFIAFFLFDVLKQCPIHPVQYGLVGGALVIFYLLVTSLSEHIAFGYSYLLAAAACVVLIGYYVAYVIGSWQRGVLIAAMISALYGVLYIILRSEENSLLMGSVLLFALIAAIMIGTRKVDWYRLGTPAMLGEKAA
jgi:inner membrane protein